MRLRRGARTALTAVNGKEVGRWPYGYSSFRVDLGEAIKPGEKNVLAIRLDNKDQSSRWYPGTARSGCSSS